MLIVARTNTVDDISHHDLIVSLTGESPETNLRPLRLHGTLVYRTARTHTNQGNTMTLFAFILSLIVSIISPLAPTTPAPVPAPTTAALTPYVPCAEEDSPGPCYWDAARRGNGHGTSFIVNNDQTVTYVTPEQLDSFVRNITHPPIIETYVTPEQLDTP